MVSILSFFTPGNIFFGTLVIVASLIIVLTIIERRLHKKIKIKRKEKEDQFKMRLELLKQSNSDPENFLLSMDLLVREFLLDKFNVNRDLKYSDLSEALKEKHVKASSLCDYMQEALYAGESLDEQRIRFLLQNLEGLINEASAEGNTKIRDQGPGTKKDKSETEKHVTESVGNVKDLETIKRKLIKGDRNESPVQEAKPGTNSRVTDYQEGSKIDNQFISSTSIQRRNVIQRTGKQSVITKYLREGLRRGFKLDPLKQKLLEAGYLESEINEVIGYLNLEISPGKMPLRSKEEVVSNKDLNSPRSKKDSSVSDKYSDSEPKSYRYIKNFDDLDRVKKKIDERKKITQNPSLV